MHNIRKILLGLVISILVFVVLFVAIYVIAFFVSERSLRTTFQKLACEVDHIPPMVTYGTLHIDEQELNIASMCYKNNTIFLEVLCVADDKVYFVYLEEKESQDNWVLDSLDLKTQTIETICAFPNAKTEYRDNQYSEYKDRNGYYADGIIVLTDHETLIQYDLESAEILTFQYDSYVFPQKAVVGEVIDANTIKLYLDGMPQVFSLTDMAKHSKGISQLLALKNKKTWSGSMCLSGFFATNTIQVVNNQIYTMAGCLNYYGESYAVLLMYDQATGVWKYVSEYFSGDTIGRDCYLVEHIKQ